MAGMFQRFGRQSRAETPNASEPCDEVEEHMLSGDGNVWSLASKATLQLDVSSGHWSGDWKKPLGHFTESPVLTFEITSRFSAASFRHTAPPSAGMT